MGKSKILYLSIFLFVCILFSGCSDSVKLNDTPPDMMPKDNVFTISNDTDLVYRGESVNTNDLVYRGERYEVKEL